MWVIWATVGREERRSVGILYFLIIISVSLKLTFCKKSIDFLIDPKSIPTPFIAVLLHTTSFHPTLGEWISSSSPH